MKRKLLRYLPLMLLATIIMVASAKYVKAEAATCLFHSWKAATCTTAKTCTKCGKTSGSALGHSYNVSAATCTTDKKCTRSGCTYVAQRALGHSYNVSAATCTTAKKCTRSGCGYVAQNALQHSYRVHTATCTTAKKCTRSGCGYVAQAALGHSYNVTSATCTTAKKCTRTDCGYVAQAALGHSYNITSATCTEAKKCTRSGCGYVAQKELGHYYIVDKATCTVSKRCIRSGCGYVAQKELGHLYNIPSATCLEAKKCTRSGCSYVAQNALDHSYNVDKATCTVAKKCTRSGCGYVAQKKLEHIYQYSYTDPTCVDAGVKTTTCSRSGCDYKNKELYKNPLGHLKTVTTAKADGKLWSVCGRSGCGKEYVLENAPKKSASTYSSNINIVLSDIANGTSDLLKIGNNECTKVWTWYYNKSSSSSSAWCGATTAYLMSVAGLNTRVVQKMAETDSNCAYALTGVGQATYFYQRNDDNAKNNCFYPLPGYTTNSKITTTNRGAFSNIKTGDLLMVNNGSAAFGHIGIAYVSGGKKYIIHGNWGDKMCMNEIKADSEGKVNLYYGSSKGEAISGYADIQAFISNNNLGVMYTLGSSKDIPKFTIGSYTFGGYTR